MMFLLGEEYFQLIFSVKNLPFSSKTWRKPGAFKKCECESGSEKKE
jgi:hypothetical protein